MRRRVITSTLLLAAFAATSVPAAGPDEPPGAAIYHEHCGRCHGDEGTGTTDVPAPLVGDRSVSQLAAYIDETMPEDDPSKVTGEAARQVAAYIHEAFYSAVARDRNRPARAELQRLTVRQHRSALADVVGSFRGPAPPMDDARGLRGEYFKTREFNRDDGFAFERIDPQIDFDYGLKSPEPEKIEAERFAVRWTGSIVPAETGRHEFVFHTDHSARLWINADEGQPATIDAYVKSGDGTEHRGSVFLLGGRPHPLRLEFSKANQGVDKKENEKESPASIRLSWRPPHGTLEVVPERVLIPQESPPVFAATTPFPPDDRSLGYDRGSGVSAEWFAAATAAAIETADHLLERLDRLAHVSRDAADREARLREFAATVAARAFRQPLSADLRALVVDRPFSDAPDLDTALRRSLLATLGSPRFLFREPPTAADGFATAARLSFGLWDSIPDEPLLAAARAGELDRPEGVRPHAERMVADRLARSKVRDFLFSWLRVDLGPEIVKDPSRHPEFTPEVAADLRTSLEIMLDDVAWRSGDFRRLFTADEVHLNGRLAPLYGVDLPAATPFTAVRLDEGRRGGVLSHPYLMCVLSYPASSSPIHRGVFLARSILGNVLKPPKQAIAPLAADQAPDLTTRERVAAQTAAVACQSCHTMINPLGFALEEFDAIGRHRTVEPAGGVEKPINASGSYRPRTGPAATFRGAKELGDYCATSHDAQEAFVQAIFHAIVKQPVRAWGPDTLPRLRASFEAGGFEIRRLLVDIMEVAAFPPPEGGAATTPAPDVPRDAPP
jgi:mono/diheme cytochrome c family protein